MVFFIKEFLFNSTDEEYKKLTVLKFLKTFFKEGVSSKMNVKYLFNFFSEKEVMEIVKKENLLYSLAPYNYSFIASVTANIRLIFQNEDKNYKNGYSSEASLKQNLKLIKTAEEIPSKETAKKIKEPLIDGIRKKIKEIYRENEEVLTFFGNRKLAIIFFKYDFSTLFEKKNFLLRFLNEVVRPMEESVYVDEIAEIIESDMYYKAIKENIKNILLNFPEIYLSLYEVKKTLDLVVEETEIAEAIKQRFNYGEKINSKKFIKYVAVYGHPQKERFINIRERIKNSESMTIENLGDIATNYFVFFKAHELKTLMEKTGFDKKMNINKKEKEVSRGYG
jgi:hypothetical protein